MKLATNIYAELYKAEALKTMVKGFAGSQEKPAPVLKNDTPTKKNVKGFAYQYKENKLKQGKTFKQNLIEYISKQGYNKYGVYRPKLTPMHPKTVDRFVNDFVAKFNLDSEKCITESQGTITEKGFVRNENTTGSVPVIKRINKLYYTLEYDRVDRQYHLNFLIQGSGISKKSISKAMKRNPNEIGYLEDITCNPCVSKYVNKHINKISRGVSYGFVDGNQIVETKLFENEVSYKTFDNHPNKKYHDQAKLHSSYEYGWRETS
jgi:hypothetical protein